MLIEEKSLQHWIDYFYGYGSWHAPFWFIGYEEGGGDLPEEVAGRLDYFERMHGSAKDAELCDIRELYKHVTTRITGPRASLFNNLYDYRFGKSAVQNSIWSNLAAFVHGYQNKKLPDLLTHQKKSFANPAGQEALIQLYPLPSPHNHAWYYSWLDLSGFRYLKSRESYQKQLYTARVQAILSKIAQYQPKVVLFYGMSNIAALKQSVAGHFHTIQFKSMKAVPRIIPQHHYGSTTGTQILVTTQIPALRHNRVETGFDWLAFGNRVRAYGQR